VFVLQMPPVTASDLECLGVLRRHLLLHRISLHVSNPAISGCGLALSPGNTVPLEFRLSASGLCRLCAPVAGLAEKLKNAAQETSQEYR
jgi:hypothetical protein